ncbi:MAG: ribonuclease HI family protein [Ignisphaera sp.]|nr:ribonuclease HI family protein [Ignisphaera sp.]MCX8167429.1 ribonuclease HI family protein [Ignisphaera sp.]MDW8086082.1 ribonuclease HI [Ignisphaera sp.]
MIKGYFDGLCEPINPGGVATYGYVVYRGGKQIASGYGVIGAGMLGNDTSNNIAEYHALIKLLEKLVELGMVRDIEIYGDSQLVINQINGVFMVRSSRIRPLYERAIELLNMLQNAKLIWIPREMNKEADRLSYKAYAEFMERYGKEALTYYKRYLVSERQSELLRRLGMDVPLYTPRRLLSKIYVERRP